jgi:RNA 2',3'-cyclic 3'-phosphodiesterase
MIRAFVAIPLPPEILARLAALQHMLPLPRRVPEENLHLTLVFLGELAEPLAVEVHEALEAVRAPRITVTLRGADTFGGDRPRTVFAGVAPEPALDRLQAKVETAARRAGATVERRRFVPHVTLARLRPGSADAPALERAILDTAGFAPGSFEADRFTLFRSHLGHGRPHYEPLAEYPLG